NEIFFNGQVNWYNRNEGYGKEKRQGQKGKDKPQNDGKKSKLKCDYLTGSNKDYRDKKNDFGLISPNQFFS
ncbi:MAG: hypothetical protein UT59_C0049G0001, partial [candidate division CPR2 bacterium GW2011_GWD1_39_7]